MCLLTSSFPGGIQSSVHVPPPPRLTTVQYCLILALSSPAQRSRCGATPELEPGRGQAPRPSARESPITSTLWEVDVLGLTTRSG